MAGSVIVITSGKGGVGKTTTSANIGTALAHLGYKVVLIDTDIGLRNLDLLLGLENRIVYTIVDVVEERCKLKQALVKDKKNPNLCLLAAAQTRDKSAVDADQLKDICEKLKEDFDYVLVDCPAGIEQGFQNAVAGANEAIVVTTPEMSAIRDADRIIGLLESKEGVEKYRLLVNRVRPKLIKSNDMMGVDDAILVSDRKFGGSDVLSTSYTLAQALTCAGPFDLIICGRQTTDGDTAQVGSELAELLGIPHAANITEVCRIDEKSLTAVTLLPGSRMRINIKLPALIAVDESIAEPRLPSYKLKLATADREIKILSLKDFADTDENHYGQAGSPTRVVRVFPPEHNTIQERWEGCGKDNAKRLADFLEQGKFLQNPR